MAARRWAAVLAACSALLAAAACQAGVARYCDSEGALSAGQKDKLFRFGGIIKAELEKSGHSLALVARSGLDLDRFGLRYSHAGVSLKANADTPWAVRQLYFACDEGRPRIFDQGLSAFLLGTDEPSLGYVSAVFLPPLAAAELERAALDNRQALQLLAATYSANAYPYSLRYQNCNQWLMEMLAVAWGRLDAADDARGQAQAWLKSQGYSPSVVDVGNPLLMWAGNLIPWVHGDDHPADDIAQAIYRVSMPASIETFVKTTVPGATRLEFCHTDRHVVIHRGWEPIADGCLPGEGDTVVALD